MSYRYFIDGKAGGIVRETHDEVLKDLVSVGLAEWVEFTTSRAKMLRRGVKIAEWDKARAAIAKAKDSQ